ncbi:aldo/keto reductase [Staphylococcus simulans]|uniref:aldo/keto reductase n=1 Tax=Staphylococcus simulans TaxID=1286 RepID=UPI000D1D3F19|nr:aldo/keto reductase [Staphylococcus simulans]PTJ21967.1 aldo/keto reductase [Staphylococcus simulans]
MNTFTLYNGQTMPQLGLGTYRIDNNDELAQRVSFAIEHGYRSIDTAARYGNEEKVGEGIKKGIQAAGIQRSDLFITSKLWLDDYGRMNVEEAYQRTLDKLDLNYLDLYLMHWPGSNEEEMIDTWKGMEDLLKQNKVKNIGVSNFQPHHLESLLSHASIKPVINQIEFHPYLTQNDLRLYLKVQRIQAEAWSPFMNGDILKDETIQAIADEVEKSPAQVVLRWHIQHDVIVIPKSITPSRIKENINVFDFELSDDQMKRIDLLNQNKSIDADVPSYKSY